MVTRARDAARAVTPAQQAASGAPAAARAGIHTGAEARARALEEDNRQKQEREFRATGNDLEDYNRRRFWLDAPGKVPKNDRIPSMDADLIVLDRSWDDFAYIYEHNVQDGDGFWQNETCVHEMHICPICAKGSTRDQRGSYVMHCSVLDLRQYHNAKLGIDVTHTKKPLVCTKQVQNALLPLFSDAMERYGTVRGMHLWFVRDATVNSRVGMPKPQAGLNGALYEMIPEADILAEFDNEDLRDAEGVLLKAAHFDITPFPYMQILPDPNDPKYLEYLRNRYGGGAAPAGSAAANADWSGSGSAPQVARPRSRSATIYDPKSQVANDELKQQAQETAPNAAATTTRVRSRDGASAPAKEETPIVRERVRNRSAETTQPAAGAKPSGGGIKRASSSLATTIDDDIPF